MGEENVPTARVLPTRVLKCRLLGGQGQIPSDGGAREWGAGDREPEIGKAAQSWQT